MGLQYSFAMQPSGMTFSYVDLRSLVLYSIGSLGLGYSTESTTRQRPYAGIGLSYSYAYIAILGCGACLPTRCIDMCAPVATSGHASGPGGKAFAGFSVAQGFSIEGGYDVSPAVNGVNTNAIQS